MFVGIIFIPTYIRYLGLDAYGLIGIFAAIQTWLGIFDMVISPTLSREMARYVAGEYSIKDVKNLLRTAEVITLIIVFFIIFLLVLSSNWLAINWVNSESLTVAEVSNAFIAMGVISALRVFEGVYRSVLVGLQKQVELNLIGVLMSTLRALGAYMSLAYISPTIATFFSWQLIISVLTIATLLICSYKMIPGKLMMGKFSLRTLQKHWVFGGSMLLLSILTLFLTGIDKLMLPKFIALSDFAGYSLSLTISAIIWIFVNPIISAIYPKACELVAAKNNNQLSQIFHFGSQLVTVSAGSIALVVIFFSSQILRVWTGNENLALRFSIILSTLMLSNLLNSFLYIPYHFQLAYGWTSLAIKMTMISIAIIIPLIYFLTPLYGIEAIPWIYIGLHLTYIIIGAQFIFKKILIKEKNKWYVNDILIPIISMTIFVAVVKIFSSTIVDKFQIIFMLLAIGVGILIIGTIAAKELRDRAFKYALTLLKS